VRDGPIVAESAMLLSQGARRAIEMMRDLALLKLFFGADIRELAAVQLETHRKRLTEYETLHTLMAGQKGPAGPRLSLELGIRHERETVDFWAEQAHAGKKKPAGRAPGRLR
jgi:hypothetical protein